MDGIAQDRDSKGELINYKVSLEHLLDTGLP